MLFVGCEYEDRPYLTNEFDRLFASHFGTNRHYRDILLALAEHHWADREQLSRWCKLDSGGRISDYLQNLQTAGFVEEYAPVDRLHAQRGLRYRLVDPYLLFYFRFVHRNRKRIQNQVGPPNMSTFMPDRAYAVWRGIAFEFVCYLHHFELATALGFSAVSYQVGPWFEKGEKGRKAQIDLLFIRADNVITLCEIKFLDDPVGVQVIKDVQHKIATLANPRKKTVERVLVTASPPTTALRNEGYFHRIVELASMFRNTE